MACFIHYRQFNNISKLVDVNENTYQTLIENKNIRKRLSGENSHIEQCNNIPDEYVDGLQYHRECYQKFTYAKTLLKRKNVEKGESSSSKRSSGRNQNTQINVEKKFLFPRHCYFCKKNRITVNKKEEYPSNIVTTVAQETLVRSATIKNDLPLLGLIKDVDLIAAEFMNTKSVTQNTHVL